MAVVLDASCDTSLVDVAGVKTFVLTCGKGHPVLLVHGAAAGGSALVSWKKTIVPLARAGFMVYAYDQPGFGQSEIPADHSMDFRMRHLEALLGTLDLGRVHVMGNSQGAYMAARLALAVANVDRLVLVSSGSLAPEGSAESRELRKKHAADLNAYRPSLEAMRVMTERTLYKRELVDELVEERYAMSVGPLYDAMLARAATAAPTSLEDRLGEIKNRTLLIWGDRDSGVTMERGLLLFEALADAELHLFHDAAHWPQWDQADRFNQLVSAFLSTTH